MIFWWIKAKTRMLIIRKMQTKQRDTIFLPIGIEQMPVFLQDHTLVKIRGIVYWDRPDATSHPGSVLEVSVETENKCSTPKKHKFLFQKMCIGRIVL